MPTFKSTTASDGKAAWPHSWILHFPLTTREIVKVPKKLNDENWFSLSAVITHTHSWGIFHQRNGKWKWRVSQPAVIGKMKTLKFPFNFGLGEQSDKMDLTLCTAQAEDDTPVFQGFSCLEWEEREQASTCHWLISCSLRFNIWTLNVQLVCVDVWLQTHTHTHTLLWVFQVH